MKVVAHLLAPHGAVPNPPRWPAAWRNGVFPYHHYHADGHEVLGVYSGEVTVLFGGEGGVEITARPGDVVVLPAGTGHKKTSVAAISSAAKSTGVIARVPLPPSDPVCGAGGPLFTYWQA